MANDDGHARFTPPKQDPRDGKWYTEMYAPDEQGHMMAHRVEVENPQVLAAQRDLRSSDAFLQSAKFYDAASGKNLVRRAKAIEQMAGQMLVDMVQPPSTPEFRSISDDSFIELSAHPEAWEDLGYEPVAKYYTRQLQKIRPLFKGEVGKVEKDGVFYYLVLEKAFEKGHLISNPDHEKVANPLPPPPPEDPIRAYEMTATDGRRAVLYALSDEDAVDVAVEVFGDACQGVPVRAETFDKCSGHIFNLQASRDGGVIDDSKVSLYCVTCGAGKAKEDNDSVES